MEFYILAFMLFAIIATLYSSVGHAGASGYLAIMSLLSFSPESIKPTSLILNIFVATIASIKFIREGYFDRKIFFAFIVTSVPLAFVGGYLSLDTKVFKLIAGIFLILSACLLVSRKYIKPSDKIKPMPIFWGFNILGVIVRGADWINIRINWCWRRSFSLSNYNHGKLDHSEEDFGSSCFIYSL